MKADWCQGIEMDSTVWSLVECSMGIISCCLPTLRSLFVMVFSRRGARTPSDAVPTVGSPWTKHFRHTISNNTHNTHYDGSLPNEITTMNSIKSNPLDHGLGDEEQLTGIEMRTEIVWSENSPGAAPSPTPSETAKAVHSA